MVSYFECEFGFIRFENGPVLPLTYNGFHFPGFGILVKAPFGYAKSILRYPMTLLVNYARRLLSGEPTPLRNHVPPRETTALWVTTSPELYAYQQWYLCTGPSLFPSVLELLLCVCCEWKVRSSFRCVTTRLTRVQILRAWGRSIRTMAWWIWIEKEQSIGRKIRECTRRCVYKVIRLARSQRVGLTSSVVIGHSKSIISVIGYDKSRILLIGLRSTFANARFSYIIGDDKSRIRTISHRMPRQ